MSYANFLPSNGVSRQGTAEVVLGHPLTLASDRAIPGRLALPTPTGLREATTELANPAFLESLTTVDEAAWSYLLDFVLRISVYSSRPTGLDRVAELKAQLASIKAQLRPLKAQLQRLMSHPPVASPAPAWNVWSATIRQLQLMVARHEVVMNAILAELIALLRSSGATPDSISRLSTAE